MSVSFRVGQCAFGPPDGLVDRCDLKDGDVCVSICEIGAGWLIYFTRVVSLGRPRVCGVAVQRPNFTVIAASTLIREIDVVRPRTKCVIHSQDSPIIMSWKGTNCPIAMQEPSLTGVSGIKRAAARTPHMVMGSKSSDAIFESMEKDFTDATVSSPSSRRLRLTSAFVCAKKGADCRRRQ